MNADSEERNDKPLPLVARLFGFVLCVSIGLMAGHLIVPEFRRQPLQHVSDTDQLSRIQRFLRGRVGLQNAAEIGKNHERVRSAFEDVVSTVNRGTVQVRCKGRQVALGTVVDASGHVLTKASELRGPAVCRIRGGTEFPTELVATDSALDLALLRVVGPQQLLPVEFGSNRPSIGSWLAVPNGSDAPVLVGVASGLPRSIPREKGLLGVMMEPNEEGVLVSEVIPGSSAEHHGIRSGDVIYSADDVVFATPQQLQRKVSAFRPGEKVKFGILRNGNRFQRIITLTRMGEVEAIEQGSKDHEGGPLSRRRSDFPQIIQHDCPLRPKDCGGPVVDVNGLVVGINIARAGRVESYALSAEVVQKSFARLKAGLN